MPLLTPASVLAGVLLAAGLAGLKDWVPWIFAMMTFAGSLSSGFSDFRKVLLNPIPLVVCILILHFIMPLIALVTGKIVFPDDPLTVTGMILAFLIPTGIISLLWVTIVQGNVPLTLSIILLDTFLAPFLVPLMLEWWVGAEVAMQPFDMMKSLIWMIVLPSLLGMALHQKTRGRIKQTLSPLLGPWVKIGLMFVVMVNSAVVAPYFKQWDAKLGLVFCIVLCIALLGYFIGWGTAVLFKWPRAMIVSMTFNSGMRNISAGAVLAIAFFPPAVAMPVVVCMLFQQILASVFAWMLQKKYPLAQQAGGRDQIFQSGSPRSSS